MDKQTCSCPFQSTRLEVWEPHVLAHAVKANFALDRAINPKWSGATYREQYLNRTFKVGYIEMSHSTWPCDLRFIVVCIMVRLVHHKSPVVSCRGR